MSMDRILNIEASPRDNLKDFLKSDNLEKLFFHFMSHLLSRESQDRGHWETELFNYANDMLLVQRKNTKNLNILQDNYSKAITDLNKGSFLDSVNLRIFKERGTTDIKEIRKEELNILIKFFKAFIRDIINLFPNNKKQLRETKSFKKENIIKLINNYRKDFRNEVYTKMNLSQYYI